MPFTVIALILGAFSFAGTCIYASHRQWIAVWRGHRIRIRLQHYKVFLEIDDTPIFSESQSLIRKKHETEWEHPALGTTNIQIQKVVLGQDGLNLNLQIGEEIVPLFELPRHWYGQVNLSEEDEVWKKLMPVDFEQLGDPRWIAACKILQLIRQSQMADEKIREAANLLQQELRRNFETRLRLAEEDFSLLGDPNTLNELKEKLEQKILQGLEAVKSLHMVTISLEAHADESNEMNKVHQIISSLQAEEEIEKFVHEISSKKKKKAQRAEQHTEKKL